MAAKLLPGGRARTSWLLDQGEGKTAWTSQAPTKSHIDMIVVAMISTNTAAAPRQDNLAQCREKDNQCGSAHRLPNDGQHDAQHKNEDDEMPVPHQDTTP